jgi:hypothetical protein
MPHPPPHNPNLLNQNLGRGTESSKWLWWTPEFKKHYSPLCFKYISNAQIIFLVNLTYDHLRNHCIICLCYLIIKQWDTLCISDSLKHPITLKVPYIECFSSRNLYHVLLDQWVLELIFYLSNTIDNVALNNFTHIIVFPWINFMR